MASIEEEKKALRVLMHSRQAEWQGLDDADNGRACALRVRQRIESLPSFSSARTILLYSSLPGELPTEDFLSAWSGVKRLALPRVEGPGVLSLREYRPGGIVPGYKGIMEPSASSLCIEPSEIDLALVPGVAFDESGHRLGHGGGFYDRLLPQLSCPLVGVCLPFRIVPSVPSAPHDIPVDLVLY